MRYKWSEKYKTAYVTKSELRAVYTGSAEKAYLR